MLLVRYNSGGKAGTETLSRGVLTRKASSHERLGEVEKGRGNPAFFFGGDGVRGASERVSDQPCFLRNTRVRRKKIVFRFMIFSAARASSGRSLALSGMVPKIFP